MKVLEYVTSLLGILEDVIWKLPSSWENYYMLLVSLGGFFSSIFWFSFRFIKKEKWIIFLSSIIFFSIYL